MLRRLSAHLTYSNVMATIAVMIALGGTSYAATTLKKNSVTSRTIKNGQVKTADLANSAVTGAKLANGAVSNGKLTNNAVSGGKLADGSVSTAKLADNAVTGAKVADGSLTGADIDENSLQFKCEPGDYALAGRGFCAFVIDAPGGVNFTQAALACSANGRTPARLPSAGEAIAIAQGGGSPFRGTLMWTSSPAENGGGADAANAYVWQISINNDGSLNNFFKDNAKVPDNPAPTQIGCVYNWTDILGPRN
jgi:hypothetical protein